MCGAATGDGTQQPTWQQASDVGCNIYSSFIMTHAIIRMLLFALTFKALSCTSTEPIETKGFPVKNVPERDFKINIGTLHDTIASMFNFENQDKNKILNGMFYFYYPKDTKHLIYFSAETKDKAIFSKEYFSKKNTSNDIYVHAFGDVWPSKLYFSNKHSLGYRTPFIIKLTEIDTLSTRIKIIAESPTVINGTSGYSAHGAVARETAVAPTTIEEYSLLLFIASKLGDSSMLPLKLPAVD